MLVALARLHRPAEIPAPAGHAPASEVAYLDFPVSAPSGATGAGGGPVPAPSSAEPAAPSASAAEGSVDAPPGPGAAVPAAVPNPTLGAGFRDSRLYLDPRALTPPPAPPPVHERMVSGARDAILAEPDSIAARKARYLASRQVTIMGRKVTVFGDSAAAGFRTEEMELRPDVQTLPVDGRLWQTLEMSRQNSAFVRDSILRARTRATRERIDAARAAARRP